jgi:hypothetical protein
MDPFLAPDSAPEALMTPPRRERSSPRSALFWAAIPALILVCGIAVLLFYRSQPEPLPAEPPPAQPQPQSASEAPPAAPAEPAVRFPLATEPEQALPRLEGSDPALLHALATLFGEARLADLFYPDSIVRRIVATVDNLPRRKAPLRMRPLKPARGAFETTASPRGPTIADANARRYAPYVALARSIDAKALVAAYTRFYPLFQRAYEDLGYPGRYFNDRLVEAIDDMLAAPQPAAPVLLVRPRVFYEFADPDLEARSAGQKVMLRVGPDNAAVLKQKLLEIRRELTTAPKGLNDMR